MTVGRPLPIIMKFALPLIIGNMFQQLYNMADTIIVGRFVGADALAAVGSTGTIMFLVLGFASGLATGFSVLTSQAFGAQEEHRVKHSVANGVLLSVITTIILTLLSVFSMKSVLRLMNTPENIFDDAYRYIVIICAGLVVSVFYNLFSALLRAVGNSKAPLFFLVLSAVINVFLDLFLIIYMHMGTAGAAVATVTAQGISAVLCIIYIYTKVPLLRPERTDWHLSARDTRIQLEIAIPMALQYGITASGTMIMQTAINLFGSTAVAAYSAASKMQGIFTTMFMSMGQAMATYCGQNFGKGDIKHLKKGIGASVLATAVLAAVTGALIVLGLRPMLHMFFTGEVDFDQVYDYAAVYIRFCAAMYFPLGLIFIFRNSMQGCGYGFLPMMGGVVELVTRLVCAVISMKTGSYLLAAACDPGAWITAGVFLFVCWLFVSRAIDKKFQ